MSKQLVAPNPDVQDYAGMCLQFAQTVFGAPAKYDSAWEAWNATQFKHDISENVPNDISTLIWFEHWGSYGDEGHEVYGNWGHVVTFVSGRGYLSSPAGKLGTYGQSWFATISEVERAFNSKYVGWSEDINGLRVAEYAATPSPQPSIFKDEFMKIVGDTDGKGYLVTDDGFKWLESPYHASLFVRLMNAQPNPEEKFHREEIEFMNNFLRDLREGKL